MIQPFYAQYLTGTVYCDARAFTSNNDKIIIGDNKRNGTTHNEFMIPYMIYGCRS